MAVERHEIVEKQREQLLYEEIPPHTMVKDWGEQTKSRVQALLDRKDELLTRQEEFDLAQRVKNGDLQARNTLVQKNLGLVHKYVMSFEKPYLSHEDLFQEGCVGLIKAAERYDPAKGTKFSTYASWWIKSFLSMTVGKYATNIRIPYYASFASYKFGEMLNSFLEENGRLPTDKELAEKEGLPLKKIEKMRRCYEDVSILKEGSLDSEFGNFDNPKMLVHEVVGKEDPNLSDVEIRHDFSYIKNVVRDMVKKRFRKEYQEKAMEVFHSLVICRDKNGEKLDPSTLRSIGDKHGISREAVRQTQEKLTTIITERCSGDKTFADALELVLKEE